MVYRTKSYGKMYSMYMLCNYHDVMSYTLPPSELNGQQVDLHYKACDLIIKYLRCQMCSCG